MMLLLLFLSSESLTIWFEEKKKRNEMSPNNRTVSDLHDQSGEEEVRASGKSTAQENKSARVVPY